MTTVPFVDTLPDWPDPDSVEFESKIGPFTAAFSPMVTQFNAAIAAFNLAAQFPDGEVYQVQSDVVDFTAGRLARVGTAGWGTSIGNSQPQITLNSGVNSGNFGYLSSDPNAPTSASGSVLIMKYASAHLFQMARPISTNELYYRYSANSGSTWSSWTSHVEKSTNANGIYERDIRGLQRCQRAAEVDVTSTATQTFTLPIAFPDRANVAGSFSHLTGSNNAALDIANIEAFGVTETTWFVRLAVAGTSSDPTLNAEKLSFNAIGRWA